MLRFKKNRVMFLFISCYYFIYFSSFSQQQKFRSRAARQTCLRHIWRRENDRRKVPVGGFCEILGETVEKKVNGKSEKEKNKQYKK